MAINTSALTEEQYSSYKAQYYFLKECNLGIACAKKRKAFLSKLSTSDQQVWTWGESIDWWEYRWQ